MDTPGKVQTDSSDAYGLSHGVAEEDILLAKRDKNSVDFALNYSKLWCKFCRDIVTSFEKRAQYENDFMRGISKLFQSLDASANCFGVPMSKEIVLLSKTIVDQAKELEHHNSRRYRELVEVIGRQRTEFAKTRKFLKDKWKQELKKMADAESAFVKTRTSYFQRCQNGIKLREELSQAQTLMNETVAQTANETGTNVTQYYDASSIPEEAPNAQILSQLANQLAKHRTKVEGLEKKLAENDKKEMEQMYAYRETVETANKRLVELEKCKGEILCDTRLTVVKCDEVMRDSLAELCEHLYATRYKMSSHFQELCNVFREYEPCSQYIRFVMNNVEKKPDILNFKYHFEGYHELVQSGQLPAKTDASIGKFVNRFTSVYGIKEVADSNDPNRVSMVHGSDSDSDLEEVGNLSVNRGGNMLNSLVEFGSNLFRPDSKKMSVRVKNRPNAIQQSQQLDSENSTLNLRRDFNQAGIVIAYCILGIENQESGLNTHGIYRVPASKVKVATVGDSLANLDMHNCYQPHNVSNLVLDEQPLTLSSLVKSKLISLPEPLFTYNMYTNFIEIGKALEGMDNGQATYDENIDKLAKTVQQLPTFCRRVAGMLFHHLHRVSLHQSENQMGSVNLGTMFGPTVLKVKPKFQVANMMEFVDNKAQVKFVETLIDHAHKIFEPIDQYDPITVLRAIEEEHTDQCSGDLEEDAASSAGNLFNSNNDIANYSIGYDSSTPQTSRSAILMSHPPYYTPYKDSVLAVKDGANKDNNLSGSTLYVNISQNQTAAAVAAESNTKCSLSSISGNPSQSSPIASSNISSSNSPREPNIGHHSPSATSQQPQKSSISLATSLSNMNFGPDVDSKNDSSSNSCEKISTSMVTGFRKLVTSKSQQIHQQLQSLNTKFSALDSEKESKSSSTVSKLVLGKRRSILLKNRSNASMDTSSSSPSANIRSMFSFNRDSKNEKLKSFNISGDCDFIDMDDDEEDDFRSSEN